MSRYTAKRRKPLSSGNPLAEPRVKELIEQLVQQIAGMGVNQQTLVQQIEDLQYRINEVRIEFDELRTGASQILDGMSAEVLAQRDRIKTLELKAGIEPPPDLDVEEEEPEEAPEVEPEAEAEDKDDGQEEAPEGS
jgi:hypothetical protein